MGDTIEGRQPPHLQPMPLVERRKALRAERIRAAQGDFMIVDGIVIPIIHGEEEVRRPANSKKTT